MRSRAWWWASSPSRSRWRLPSPSASLHSTASTRQSSPGWSSRSWADHASRSRVRLRRSSSSFPPSSSGTGWQACWWRVEWPACSSSPWGLFRLGRLIQFIPHPITTGFTTGIATVIGVLQLKDLLGLRPARVPDHFLERVWSYVQARHTANLSEMSIGALTLAVLALLPRVTKRVPAPLIALPLAAVAAWLAHRFVAGFDVATHRLQLHHSHRRPGGARDPATSAPANLALARGCRPPAAALDVPGPVAGRGCNRLAGRDRVAALGGGGRRHGRHQARPPTASCWPSGWGTCSVRSSVESPAPARSRARRPASATAAVRRSRP